MAEQELSPKVGVIMGSDSDLPIMEEALQVLDEFEIPYEVRILSAHRSPGETSAYARSGAERGLKVLIAAAGWAAHLAGVLAAGHRHTGCFLSSARPRCTPLHGPDAAGNPRCHHGHR